MGPSHSTLRYLDIQRYTDWVYNAPEGSKPWIIMFGDSAMGNPEMQQATDSMLRLMICLGIHYKDQYNIGYMDYRKSEKVQQAYDMILQFGIKAPYLMVLKNGRAYHL